MYSIENDDNKDHYCSLQVLTSSDLIKYYNETKRILVLQDDDSGGGENKNNNASSLSSLSLNPKRSRRSRSNRSNNAFSLQQLEPRHRRSMMRCVLNNPDTKIGSATSVESKAKIIAKADFQHQLRSVERRKRWNITRRLLFGDGVVDGVGVDSNGNGNGNGNTDPYWWDVISEEKAPEFVKGIQEYRSRRINNENDDSTNSATANHKNGIEEEDPKRFLSRLARGRTYKGNFRMLLEDYVTIIDDANTDTDVDVDFANDNDNDNIASNCHFHEAFLPMYDEIIGVGAKTKLKGEDNKNELKLLRMFVDELEAAAAADNNRTDITAQAAIELSSTEAPSMIADKDQINLLRKICDLDIFASSPSTSSSRHNDFVDDGGLSVGKRGERDLKSYLEEQIATNRKKKKIPSSSSSMVLSPVWVRPKHKNRRNSKQKCRYVLEIPTATTTSKINDIMSSGTTSEFDAMVVRIVNNDDSDNGNGNKDDTDVHPLPIMAIQEVWDAKATLDPSALLDVLDKKVASLRKILLDENSRVVNVAALCSTGENAVTTTTTTTTNNDDTNKDNDKAAAGAKFVILPPPENMISQDDCTNAISSMPSFYRAGIQPIESMDDNNIDADNDDADGSYGLALPQIGVFASRMLSPRAAARRIQTIVYERLLETDLGTVRSITILNSSGNHDNHDDRAPTRGGDDDDDDGDGDDPSCSNRIVRDKATEIVERIIRSIHTVRPIVVVGTLPSNVM